MPRTVIGHLNLVIWSFGDLVISGQSEFHQITKSLNRHTHLLLFEQSPQAVLIRRSDDALLSDNSGDQIVWCDVERWIPDGGAGRRQLRFPMVRHLARVALRFQNVRQ